MQERASGSGPSRQARQASVGWASISGPSRRARQAFATCCRLTSLAAWAPPSGPPGRLRRSPPGSFLGRPAH
eukprot:16441297-Heterocapsa_arctica.AAC.1